MPLDGMIPPHAVAEQKPMPRSADRPDRSDALSPGSLLADRSTEFVSADEQGRSVLKAIEKNIDFKALTHPEVEIDSPHVLRIENISLHYGLSRALYGVNLNVPAGKIVALIGPSGCGKSTLLRTVNRLNDLIDNVKVQGNMYLNDEPIYGRDIDVTTLRKRIGMVFQKSNPFPKSIYENVVYGLRIAGERRRRVLDEVCERCLRDAALWDEVKERLHESALALSGGQQQRLCIARAVATQPEILLMDEPCSALDPIATAKVEELMSSLRGKYTVLIVTHNMQQASRVSDYTAFMYLGRLVEYGPTDSIFQKPRCKDTEDYVTGRFG
jgi:phosphate transport system ATP-binding protein